VVTAIESRAPGRVNLIGDHTDYAGGLVLPMAIDLGTTVHLELQPGSRLLELTSDDKQAAAVVDLDCDAVEVEPSWARFVAAVAAVVPPAAGGRGRITTTLPLGAGLSSSSALSVSLALAFGLDPQACGLAAAAETCRQAEQLATGVASGIMDQLTCLAGRRGHALLIDCGALSWEPVPLPAGVEILVAHCGQPRRLAGSAYAARRRQCEAAAALVGPLATAAPADVEALADPLLRRRARHVVSENARVASAADALAGGELDVVGDLMADSHRSLAEDFEVSTPALDDLVATLAATPGVFGARLTGAGFGGCAVALAARGSFDPATLPSRWWLVEAADGAKRSIVGG
jgi:galactokinase